MDTIAHFLGQSGWLIELPHRMYLFDYWRGDIPGVLYDTTKELVLFVSHNHADHFNRKFVATMAQRANTIVVLSSDVKIKLEGAVRLKENESAVVNGLEIKTYGSTDAGVSFFLRDAGISLFHAGDLNLWHWPLESTPEEIHDAERSFDAVLKKIAENHKSADIAMFPIDPRQQADYDRGARDFAQLLHIGWFLPMHFGSSVSVLEPFASWASVALPQMKVPMPQVGVPLALEI